MNIGTMEVSCELHSEDNKSLPDKSKKRKLKTPSQVEALEKFYNEHKYPTEAMKTQLAESVGLTEKQVSGWFCHRRLKDKRTSGGEAYDNVRQDRSSGVIQDHGSGHRQDSCGSSKEGDNRHFDLKEVESKRFSGGQEFSAADYTHELVTHHKGNDTDTDDTSSGSSFPLQHRFVSKNQKPSNDMATSRYIAHGRNIVPVELVRMQTRTRPSGYLKVKGQVENPAITAVKRQLGRHYCEDGPPLGVEFDPLPPGAFESPTRDPVNECHDSVDRLPHKSEFSVTDKQLESGMRHEAYNCKMNLQNLELDGTRSKFFQGSDHQDYYSNQCKPKDLLPRCSNPYPGKNSSAPEDEGYPGEMSPYDDRKLYRMGTKHELEDGRIDSFPSNYASPYRQKAVNAKMKPLFGPSDDASAEGVRIEQSQLKYLHMDPMNGVSLSIEDRKPTRRMNKESNFYGGRRATGGYYNSAVAVHRTNDMRVIKRGHEDSSQQQYMRKASTTETPMWTNQPKRSAADHQMPSSFSEDETAVTSSSED